VSTPTRSPAWASLQAQDPVVEDGQLTIESASLSEGGYVVVHAEDADGEVLGVSDYLASGSHSEVTIQLDSPPSSGQRVAFVVHQETNGNNQLDYDFGARDDLPPGAEPPPQPDEPYPAAGQSPIVVVEATIPET